jgi:hypothetical protein
LICSQRNPVRSIRAILGFGFAGFTHLSHSWYRGVPRDIQELRSALAHYLEHSKHPAHKETTSGMKNCPRKNEDSIWDTKKFPRRGYGGAPGCRIKTGSSLNTSSIQTREARRVLPGPDTRSSISRQTLAPSWHNLSSTRRSHTSRLSRDGTTRVTKRRFARAYAKAEVRTSTSTSST